MTDFQPDEIEEICRKLRNEADKERRRINGLHNLQMSDAPHYEARAKLFERAADILAVFESRSKR